MRNLTLGVVFAAVTMAGGAMADALPPEGGGGASSAAGSGGAVGGAMPLEMGTGGAGEAAGGAAVISEGEKEPEDDSCSVGAVGTSTSFGALGLLAVAALATSRRRNAPG